MKAHWLVGMAALIASMLACSSPFYEEPRYTATTINVVKVSPPSGSGSFILEVTYETFWIPGKRIPNIHCYYVTPDLVTVEIGVIDMFEHIGAREIVTATKTLPFTVSPKNGATSTGNYLAGCTTETNTNTVNTNFTVVGDPVPTQTFTPEPAPASTSTPQPTAITLKGKIIFDYNGYQSDRPSGGGELDLVTKECIPEVTINQEGLISGTCEKPHITARLVDESFSAQVTGQVDQTGNITFLYDVSEIGTPNGAWRISYEGQGKFTSTTQAAGTATFSYSCNSGSDNLIWCWQWTSESFSGTVPWSFIPSP